MLNLHEIHFFLKNKDLLQRFHDLTWNESKTFELYVYFSFNIQNLHNITNIFSMHSCMRVCVCVCVCVCVPSSSHPTSSESHALHVLPSPPRNKSHTWFTWQGLFELSLTENVDGTASAVRCNIEMFLPALPWKTSPPFFFFFFARDLLSIREVSRRLAVVQLGLVLNLIRGRKVVQKVYGDTDRPLPLTPPASLFLFFFFSWHMWPRTSHIHGRCKHTTHVESTWHFLKVCVIAGYLHIGESLLACCRNACDLQQISHL